MTNRLAPQEDRVGDPGDAWDVFMRRDLARHYAMPTDLPGELLALVNEIAPRSPPRGG